MSPEQEIELLKGQVANLYGMLMSSRDSEIPVGMCGPNIKNDVLTSNFNNLRESFDFKKTDGANFYIYGGAIRWGSWDTYNLPDDTFTTVAGGELATPHCVALRLEWSLGPVLGTTLQYVSAEFPPRDDGTYGWRPLYAVWMADDKAVCGKSMRHAWNLTSTIGAG